jgi:ABC-type transport system involved in cytochrome bd biosynthesis fused ATPase/permease subunit
MNNEKDIRINIDNIMVRLNDLELKRDICNSNFKKVDLWLRVKEDLKKYMMWEQKINTMQIEETERKQEYTALLTLREQILESESIVVSNLVESINAHAKVYLDDFFEDDPIVVTLQAFKHTKKNTKAQINMDIEYKGMECDLQMLSGGEMSRIVLAYTLALAEMFNTPLLLLDECTASLDQETTNHVFDAIKEHFNGKLTIIVAHQVVTGIFDNTVNLE